MIIVGQHPYRLTRVGSQSPSVIVGAQLPKLVGVGPAYRWPFLNEVGNFVQNLIATEVVAARAASESFWSLVIFQGPSVAAGALGWVGRSVSLSGKWGIRLESGEIRTWIQSTGGTSLVFDIDTSGPYGLTAPELLLVTDVESGGNGVLSWFTSSSTKSFAAYSRSSLPSDFDEGKWGGRSNGGGTDNFWGGQLFGIAFGRGGVPSIGDIRGAFGGGRIQRRASGALLAAMRSAGGASVAFMPASGLLPTIGPRPTVNGTIVYTGPL